MTTDLTETSYKSNRTYSTCLKCPYTIQLYKLLEGQWEFYNKDIFFRRYLVELKKIDHCWLEAAIKNYLIKVYVTLVYHFYEPSLI